MPLLLLPPLLQAACGREGAARRIACHKSRCRRHVPAVAAAVEPRLAAHVLHVLWLLHVLHSLLEQPRRLLRGLCCSDGALAVNSGALRGERTAAVRWRRFLQCRTHAPLVPAERVQVCLLLGQLVSTLRLRLRLLFG